jgi:DNA repair protein RadD
VQLRDYQTRLIGELSEALDSSCRPLAVAPTGSGKSHVIGALVAHYLERGIPSTVLCHRREIALHLQRVIGAHTGAPVEVVTADNRTPNWDAPAVVAMVPTLSRRLRSTPAGRGGLVVLDEAHHATASTWQRVVAHLAPDRLAGVTATAVSCNGTPLGAVFDRLVLGPEPADLVQQGHLAPCRVLAPARLISTQGLHVRAGDFIPSEAEARARRIAGDVVPTWKHHANGKQTLVACCSVRHSQETAELYRQAGVAAAHLDGSTLTAERDQLLAAFAQGQLTVLCFVSVVDEGLDLPEAEVLQFLRPTRSLRLRRQLEGRIRRPHPGKAECLVLDHTDSWRHLPLPDEPVGWALDQPGEAGASIRRQQGLQPRQDAYGVVQLVEVPGVPFRPVTGRRGAGSWIPTTRELVNIAQQLDHPGQRQRLLDAVRRGRLRPYAVLDPLLNDPASRLEHFQLLGQAAAYQPGWAHHQMADSLGRTTPPALTAQLQRQLDQRVERLVEQGQAGAGLLGALQVAGVRDGCLHIHTSPSLARLLGWEPARHHRAKRQITQLAHGLQPGHPVVVLGLPLADGARVEVERREARALAGVG